jgi:hypothetical protein
VIKTEGTLSTDKKENQIFLIYKEIQKGSVAKSYSIWLNICSFPHILVSPSSYMTLQPIPPELPNIHEENFFFFFINVIPVRGRGFGVYSINKTGCRREMSITSAMPQIKTEAAQHLLKTVLCLETPL